MYNQPYFIPGYYSSMAAPSMMRGAMGGALRGASATAGASRGLGLFSRLGNSMHAIRGVNWGGLITNASKTLNVVNQAIPLVRQVGPMFNNMRSMLRLASIFKDETDNVSDRTANRSSRKHTINSNNNFTQNRNNNIQQGQRNLRATNSNIDINNTVYQKDYDSNDYSPTFFIES